MVKIEEGNPRVIISQMDLLQLVENRFPGEIQKYPTCNFSCCLLPNKEVEVTLFFHEEN